MMQLSKFKIMEVLEMFKSISLYYTNDDTEIAYINFNEIDHIENVNER